MSQQVINVGSAPNDGTGDVLRDAMVKVNDNFTEIYSDFQTEAGLSANVATLTANNTSYVGSVSAANVVSNSQLSGNLANYVTAFNLSNNLASYSTLSDPIFTGKITVNDYVSIGNTSQNVVVNSSSISVNGALIANSTYFSGRALTANNANNLGGTAASSYQLNSTLAANVATLTANNANNLAGVAASSYQLNSTLAANVAIFTANNANNLGGTAASNYMNTSSAFTRTGVTTFSANIVLGTSGVSANGSYGTSGQVFTSNGSSVYWSTVSSGGFSNGQSISVNNFVITGTFTANSSNGTSGQYLTSNGTATYWSSPGAASVNADAQYIWSNTQTFSNTITFSSNILVGTTVNAASYTVGSSFVANSTGVYDSIGNLRSIPINPQSSAYVLTANDNGQVVSITTGGVTVNGAVLSTGQAFTIYNNSGSNQTITSGTGATMYLGGTATTGNRTLAQRGVCSILMVASNTFVASGVGLT